MNKRFFATSFLLMALIGMLGFAASASAAANAGPPADPTPPCEARVAESGAAPFWDSYGDYIERRLTVDENLQNIGGCVPCLIRIIQVEASNGVTVESPLPVDVGDLPPAATGTVRMKFRVPEGVNRFRSHSRVICVPGPQPAANDQLTVSPSIKWANDGCSVAPPELAGVEPLPYYQPGVYTATLRDSDGNPLAGRYIKWNLSEPAGFTIQESTDVTDANGQVTSLVMPPLYWVCIAPYYDRGSTDVTALTDDGMNAVATFNYTRCAPPDSTPPWA